MLNYTDLINDDNTMIEKRTKAFQTKLQNKLDLNNADDKWLAVSYLFALDNGLKDYKARSFASELTLLLTNKLYDTDVSLQYNETKLDKHFNDKWEEIRKNVNAENEAWQHLIIYMLNFYKSEHSWKYERVTKNLKFKVTSEEREMFYNLPAAKPKQKFINLLLDFDYGLKGLQYERRGSDDSSYGVNLTIGEYERFMSVIGNSKSEKFRNLLYFYYQNKRDFK